MNTKTLGTKEWSEYSFNFSTGCTWGCEYCYAKGMAKRFKQISNEKDWVIMRSRPRPSFSPNKKVEGVIMTPTSHDLTKDNLHLAKKYYLQLLEAGNKLLIVSKPQKNIILELSDHLENFKNTDQLTWRFSITTMDENLKKIFEPKAPGISHRFEVLEEMFERGWNTSLSIEPFLDDSVFIILAMGLPLVREKIWIGIMNKQYCPKDLWEKYLTAIYQPNYLFSLKKLIEIRYDMSKIMFKDNFINNLPKEFKRSKTEISV